MLHVIYLCCNQLKLYYVGLDLYRWIKYNSFTGYLYICVWKIMVDDCPHVIMNGSWMFHTGWEFLEFLFCAWSCMIMYDHKPFLNNKRNVDHAWSCTFMHVHEWIMHYHSVHAWSWARLGNCTKGGSSKMGMVWWGNAWSGRAQNGSEVRANPC